MACFYGRPRPLIAMGIALAVMCLAIAAPASAAEAGNVAAKGCGGFVKSQKNIDFSTIEIVMETQTQSGWRKVGTTDCAPNNGYYFLPIQPGDLTGGSGPTNFRLTARPPTGWKIRPEEGVVVAVDGATDACSTNKDINFEFVGFGITGSVLSKESSSGPSDISVELLEKGKAPVVKTALTGADGSYVFFGVLPGAYTIRISQEAQSLYSFEKTTQDIEVGESEGRSAPFLISGYSLAGRVSASSLACQDADLSGVDVKMISGGKVLASTKTETSGAYRFSNVAVGSYLIRVDGSASSLDLDSTEQTVEVGHSHLTMSEFQVVGYTVSGMVAASPTNGQRPLAGVDLKITSNTGAQFNVKTDKAGKFVLRQVKSCCQLSVSAILDGYDFEVSTFSSVGPRTVLSPNIIPKRYRLSGRVDRSSLPSDLEIKVKFGQDAGKVLVSEKGTFSLYLPEGSYDVTVEVKASDSLASRGIGFAPVKQVVAVTDSPVADINFQPIKANIGGVVSVLNEFVKTEGPTLEVTLTAKDGGVAAVDAQRQTIKLDAGSIKSTEKFRFSNVLPGTYTVAVHGSEGSQICWSKPLQEITVSSDIDDIVFDQVGFYVQVESPHPTSLIITNKKGESQEAALKKGRNSICVDTKKGHQDNFDLTTKGCEKFEIEPKSVKASTATTKVVLKPTHYLVSGRIFSKATVTNLELKVKSEVRTVKLQTTRDEARGFYSFSFDALPNEELSFVPQSEEFLFDPENIHVFVENSCHIDAVHFDAVGGFFLRGQISPAVENVKVSVIAPSEAAVVNKMAAAVSHTDASGKFRLGPLPQETQESGQYRVEAVKEGYVFEQVKGGPRGHFASKKLAAIVVEVDSTGGDGNKGTRLAGAVITVSGGGNTGSSYRSNTHTDSQGEAHFLSLSPGEYFVKPQLKEFEFNPKHKLMDIVEGQTSTIKFAAKRVAFSAFGKVRSINGEPEAGITLRAKPTAKCQGGSVEEATTEAKGDFRFRGLVPGCEYSIGLREADGEAAVIERLIPAETLVVMGAADAQLKDAIVAFRTVNIMDVTMTVNDEANPMSEAPVKVVMTDHQSYSYSVKRIIGEMITLPAVTKEPGKKYTITVETFPEKYAPKRKVSTVVVTDEFYKFVNVTIPKGSAAAGSGGSAKDSTGKSQSSANKKMLFVIVLFLSGLGAYLYKDRLPAWLVSLIDKAANTAVSSGTKSYQRADDGGPSNRGDDSSLRKRPSSKRPKLVS